MTASGIPAIRYGQRLDRARAAAAAAGVDALLLGFGADLRYLSGYAAMPSERLTMLVVPSDAPPRLIVPRLEVLPARAAAAPRAGLVEVVAWEETEDPIGSVVRVIQGDGPGRLASGRVRLAVGDRLWSTFTLGVQAALPDASFVLASTVMRDLRITKDDDEVRLLQAAATAADRVVIAVAHGPLVGRTEADVSREIRDRLIDEGHDDADFAIVAAGEDGASPHHTAGDRIIAAGEPVVMDLGGPLDGYGSDITRTIWVSGGDPSRGPDPTFRRIHSLVLEAHDRAIAAVRPGVPCEAIDAAARGVIDAAGYGDRFIHRTGHGIGLEGHEPPYLVAGDATPLAPGMAFSIEPGIYLEGRYGVRIEDIVVCGPAGPIVLDDAPRELLVVDGRA
jgi:Xaa-Pro aminopeptidase